MTPDQSRSPSYVRLAALRDDLNKMKSPAYPTEFAEEINGWATKAMPVIKEDHSGQVDAFQKILEKGFTSHLQIAKMSSTGMSMIHAAWEKDNENALKKQQALLTFMDGLLAGS